MASYDYYRDNNKPLPSTSAAPPSYDSPSRDPTSAYDPAPYSSQDRLGTSSQRPTQQQPTTSPFDTVFDDHVYPVNSNNQSGASSRHQIPDTAYHGGVRSPTDDNMADDIPLRDRQAKDNNLEAGDHVYDASQSRRKERKARFGELGMFGADSKRIPFVVYFFTIAQIAVFIAEIVRNVQLTGSPIMIRPQFNPMIGPSHYVLINMGSRFVACMHNVDGVQSAKERIGWPCPGTTTNDALDPMNKCTLSELCGFGGVPEPWYSANATMSQSPEPNQWFRFIIPMFMHAGLIHIGFNLLLQLTMGREMEKAIGSVRFFLVYVSSGIFGFVMGGNFAGTAIASTGASGSLSGIIALTLLDLLYSWKDRRSPVKDLLFSLLNIIIFFVLGLLPGLDNFSHIGGFLMGLVLGISVLHSPNSLRRRIGDDSSYTSVGSKDYVSGASINPAFFRDPAGFFKGRKPLWWVWWLVRVGTLVLVVVALILLLNNFYIYRTGCSWCKYLSCIDVNDWCKVGNLTFETPKNSSIPPRDLLSLGMAQLHLAY